MGGCCVFGCSNRYEQGYILRRFPRDPKIRELWIQNIARDGWTHLHHSLVCEVHFEPQMWEKVRVDGKRKLRANAVPTIFPYKNLKTPQEQIASSNDFADDRENSVIEFIPNLPDPLDLDTKKRSSQNKNELQMYYKKLLANYKQHMKQLQDKLKELDKPTDIVLLKKCFNDDQIEVLKNSKVKRWSNETIKKALKLKFVCGDTGYRELLQQKIPLPSFDILQEHFQSWMFSAGILNEFFEYLPLKISVFKSDRQKDCAIYLEEISISKTDIYDSVTKKYSGSISHGFIITLCGIYSEWKQTIAYYFTGTSVNGPEYKNILIEIIHRTDQLGLKIIAIVCNMGKSKECFWKSLDVTAERHGLIKNSIPHLVNSRKIYILPDVSITFTKIKNMFVTHKIITVPSPLNNTYCLPSNCVNYNHIEQLMKDSNFKIVPTSNQVGLLPIYSERTSEIMDSYDVSSGLKIFTEVHNCPEYTTTAWFIDMIEKWFNIMTSKHPVLSLSKLNSEVYEESVDFLKDFIHLIQEMQVGEDNIWTPCQVEILIATQSVLDVQDLLLNQGKYNMLLTSRITEGCIEKLIKSSESLERLSCAKLRNKLKEVCKFQFLQDIVDTTSDNI